MRTFRGLENIHAVIDRHESEWRRDNGQEPAKSHSVSLEEAVRRRLTSQPGEGSGKFAADRFLGGKTEASERRTQTVTEPEPVSVEPEAVEIIKNKDGKHSWLYNEVMKAINDASKDSKNTKIIAVFIPVIQNGKEFEDLPADETITISPINENDTKIEAEQEPEVFVEPEEIPEPEDGVTEEILAPSEDFDLIPETKPEQDTELAEAFREMEDKLDSALAQDTEILPETEQDTNIPPETEQDAEIITEPEQDFDITLEPEQDTNILPEIEQDAEIFPETEQDTDIFLEPEQNTDIIPETEQDTDTPPDDSDIEDNDDYILADGEPMEFEEIETVGQDNDFALPDGLDDDDVADDGVEFDESLTEIQLPDDDDEEIELIPDPEN